MLSRLLGSLLFGYCAGEHSLAWHSHGVTAGAGMSLTSASFASGQKMPLRLAGKGVGLNLSPALAWEGVPPGTRELVLLVEDADAPLPRPFVHLIVTGIPPTATGVAEGELSGVITPPLALGRNSFGRRAYAGPRALPGHGVHRYSFQLFALRDHLRLGGSAGRGALLRAMRGQVIGCARLDGLFERP